MKLSTRGRYGTRAMIDIALHHADGSSKLKDIANRQAISAKYLDHILSSLKKAGLIKNIRGRHGGYVLAKPASQINLKNIITAVEGSLAPVECVDNPDICSRTQVCPTKDVWAKLKNLIEDNLESVTLQALTESQKDKTPQPINYTI